MNASDFDKWDQECEDINSDKQRLFDQMKEFHKKDDSADVLYRLAKICLFLSKNAEKVNNKEMEKNYATQALTYAGSACKKEPNRSECHKWFCAAVGKLANMSSTKEKIQFGKQFGEHADIALRLNPNDELMQLMYGKWCYNVASLSWLERKVAQTIYGELPKADYDMALKAFNKVHQLNPNNKDNHLWIAKCYIAKSQYKEAKQFLQKGLTLPNKNISDELAHKELDQLNKKY